MSKIIQNKSTNIRTEKRIGREASGKKIMILKTEKKETSGPEGNWTEQSEPMAISIALRLWENSIGFD